MIFLFLGIALIVLIYLWTISTDGYSDTHEAYMNAEFEKQRKNNNNNP